MAKPEIFERGA